MKMRKGLLFLPFLLLLVGAFISCEEVDVKNGADCYSKIGHAVTVLRWQS